MSDYGELVDYRDMVTTIKDIIRGHGDARVMTLERVKARPIPPRDTAGAYGIRLLGRGRPTCSVEAIYNGLKNAEAGGEERLKSQVPNPEIPNL